MRWAMTRAAELTSSRLSKSAFGTPVFSETPAVLDKEMQGVIDRDSEDDRSHQRRRIIERYSGQSEQAKIEDDGHNVRNEGEEPES